MTSLSRYIGLSLVAAVERSGCGVKPSAPVMTGIFRNTLKIRLQDVPCVVRFESTTKGRLGGRSKLEIPFMRSSLARFLAALILGSPIIPRALGQISDNWQPVTQQDLALKDNPAVPGSAAMILERQIYTDDEKRLQTEWIRTKIFTERGKAYADVQIPYLGRSTTIEGIRGRTVLADGTAIPFNGTVFDKVLVKYKRFRYDAKTFTLPGVEAGSVIEYAYTIRWKQKLPDYVRNPSGYVFQEGWTIPSTTWTIQQDLFIRHALFVLRPIARARLGWSTVRIKEEPSSQPDGTVRIEVAEVPALEKDDYMLPESMLTSRIHLYYEVGFLANYWRGWGKSRVQVTAKFIEKTKFLEQEANAIAPPADSPEARLRKLYARVQQVRNLSYEVDKTDKEIKRENLADNKSSDDTYRHGYGYGNEIDFLFTALARSVGFDATIVEAVSRDSAAFEQKVPDASQLNTMLVLIRLDGKGRAEDVERRPHGGVPDGVDLRRDARPGGAFRGLLELLRGGREHTSRGRIFRCRPHCSTQTAN